MRFPFIFTVAALALVLLGVAVAAAQTRASADAAPKALGGAKSWTAYSAGSGKTLVCYLVGKPAKTLPATVKRGVVDAHVTHRPGENAANVVDFGLGYGTKAGSDATVTIDGKTSFALFTNKDTAWTKDAASDKALTLALAKGKEAVVKATSEHNNNSTDTYDLAGFGEALALINKACNVKQ